MKRDPTKTLYASCGQVRAGKRNEKDVIHRWVTPENSIELTNIEKGKPSQNGSLERLNRTFREDILSAYLFDDLDQAQRFAYQWIWMYNNDRPHQALTGLTPRQFLLKYGKLQDQSINEEFPTFQQEHDDEYEIFKPLLFAVAK